MPEKFARQPMPEAGNNKEDILNELASPEIRKSLLRHISFFNMKFSPEEIEDVVQHAMLKATGAIREGHFDESKAKLKTWLYDIAKNAAIDLLRSKKRRSIMDPLPETNELVSKDPSAIENYIAKDMIEKLRSHFDELPPKQQEVIKLLDNGLTIKQIAGHQGVPLNTAKSRQRYALEYLKRWIEDENKK